MLKRKDCKNEIKTKYKKEVEDENYNDNDAFDEDSENLQTRNALPFFETTTTNAKTFTTV